MNALISCTPKEAAFVRREIGTIPHFLRLEAEKQPSNASRYKQQIHIWTDHKKHAAELASLIERVENLIDDYRDEEQNSFDDERDYATGNRPMERYQSFDE